MEHQELSPEDFATLKKMEEQMRLVVESSPAGLLIADQHSHIVMVNAQTERWFGYQRDELVGQSVDMLVPDRYGWRHGELVKTYFSAPKVRPMGEGRQLYAKRKDGSEFPVDISLHPMELQEGLMVLAYIVDITDRKQMEEQQKNRERIERLALLGQLAGSVAHEIRNPLGVIRNSVYYMKLVGESFSEEILESLDDIERELNTANRIVTELLDFTREPVSEGASVALKPLLDKLLAKSDVPPNVQVHSPQTDAMIEADSGQLERLFANLIRNAIQAMPAGGDLRLEIETQPGWVIVSVSDTGVGIPEKILSQIFDPLFTTKAKGFGLGLAVSRRYAENNQGKIEVESREFHGTTFRVRFRTSPEENAE